VRPRLVVIVLPDRQRDERLPQRGKQRLVEAFVAQAADESLF
jgi:hypothetical protein